MPERWQERAAKWPAEPPTDDVPATGAVLQEAAPTPEVPAEEVMFQKGTLQRWRTVQAPQRGGQMALCLRGRVRSGQRAYDVQPDSPTLAVLHADAGHVADRFSAVLARLTDGTECEFRLDPNEHVIEIRGVEGVAFAAAAPAGPLAVDIPLPPLPCAGAVPPVTIEGAVDDSFHNPYAFVAPLPRNDRDATWGRRPPPPHDVLDPERLTGDVELELETVTPYFSAVPGAQADREGAEQPVVLEPRADVPATSLKGAIRAVYEALTNSCFAVFDDSGRRVSHRVPPGRSDDDGTPGSRDLMPVRIRMDGDELIAEQMQEVRVLADAGDAQLTHTSRHFPHTKRDLQGLTDGQPVWFRRTTLELVAVGHKRYVAKLRGRDPERYEAFFTHEPDRQQRDLFPDPGAVRRGRVHRLPAPRQIGDLLLPAGTMGVEPIEGPGGQPFYPFRRDERGGIRPKRAEDVAVGTTVWFATTRRSLVTGLRAPQRGKDPPEGFTAGYLRKHGQTIHSKTFESVFFSYSEPRKLALPEEVIRDYEELVSDTQRLSRGQQAGTVASPYLTDARRQRLDAGLLLYATIDGDRIGKLFTVKIGRSLHRTSLREVLARYHEPAAAPDPETQGPYNAPGSLLPCRHGDLLCPACRLFGWVAQRGVAGRGPEGKPIPSAYRGRLRWSRAEIVSPKAHAIESFTGKPYGDGRGLPLAVLSGPKPNRDAFYLRPLDPEGTQAWEDPHSGLAGRKFYWHHHRDRSQWQVQPDADPLRFPFRRKDDVADTQNRIITGWVKPGTRFRSTVRFENLSPEELGALLTCLELPAGCHLRLGGGKPLGLGSFRSKVTGLKVLDLAASYERLGPLVSRTPTQEELRTWIDRFAASLCRAYAQTGAAAGGGAPSLLQVPFVADLFRILAGPPRTADGSALPIHYPRVTEDTGNPGPEIEWSKANQRTPLPAPRDSKALRRDR